MRQPLDAKAGMYKQASLVYRVDAGRLSVPLAAARVEGRQVSYDEVASNPLAERSIGELTVRFPHPRGLAGWAQAEVDRKSVV